VGAKKKMFTLTEISKKTGISMPTLQKYKKQHADRIPSQGEGRRQRYPREAFEVFSKLKDESLARRAENRRRKTSRSAAKTPRKSGSRTAEGLLSLQQIKEITGISYPTLLRYVGLHLDRIPHVGTGRRRRYQPEAVEVFRELRSQSPRGRRKSSAAGPAPAAADGRALKSVERRLEGLERSQAALERQLREVTRLLRKPVTVKLQRS
jgi:predicted DNA-binding transcriptional regulator AlpA